MGAPGKYKLVITEGPSRGAEFPLNRKTVGLGRDPKNQVLLNSRSVSLFHSRITVDADGCFVTNLGSIEGLKVNGKNVDSAALRPGDTLQAGNVRLRLESGAGTGKALSAGTGRSRKRKKKRGFPIPLKPSVIILSLIALLAALITLNIRWFGIITNW